MNINQKKKNHRWAQDQAHSTVGIVCTLQTLTHTRRTFFTQRQHWPLPRFIIWYCLYATKNSEWVSRCFIYLYTHWHTRVQYVILLLLPDSILIGQNAYIRKPNYRYIDRFERDHQNQIEIHSFNNIYIMNVAERAVSRIYNMHMDKSLCNEYQNIDNTTILQIKC